MVDVTLTPGAPRRVDRAAPCTPSPAAAACPASTRTSPAWPRCPTWRRGATPSPSCARRSPSTCARVEQATGDWRQAVDGAAGAPSDPVGTARRGRACRVPPRGRRPLERAAAPDGAREHGRSLAALRDDGRLTVDPARVETVIRSRRAGCECPDRRDQPRRRLGRQLHRTRTPTCATRATRWSTTCSAPARAAPSPSSPRQGWASAPTRAGSIDEQDRTGLAALDARGAPARRAVGVHRDPRDPYPGTRGRAATCSTRSPPSPAPWPMVGSWAVTTRSPGPATRSVCRSRPPPRRPRRSTPGVERVMRLQSGGEDLIREAVAARPRFRGRVTRRWRCWATRLAPGADVAASLATAQQAAGRRADERERSLRRRRHAAGSPTSAAPAPRPWCSHLAQFPRDVLAASAAVPTIAFSGVTDVQQEAWDLVEGLAPAYGDHWWYISLLAFTRQDQSRFDEAGMLAESALSCEPSSGHAVHAQTHVLYETGQHEGGRVWLDHWVAESGRGASHRAPLRLARRTPRPRARRHRGGAAALLRPARDPAASRACGPWSTRRRCCGGGGSRPPSGTRGSGTACPGPPPRSPARPRHLLWRRWSPGSSRASCGSRSTVRGDARCARPRR